MPPGARGRKLPASSTGVSQSTRYSPAATTSRSPVKSNAKSPAAVLPPPSSPSSRLVLGSRGHKRSAPNGVRPSKTAVNGSKSNKRRRTQQSSSSSDEDGSGAEDEEDNGGSTGQHNGEPQLPRRYSIRPQPQPTAPPATKGTNALNTLFNYFSSAAAASSSSTYSSPASSSSPSFSSASTATPRSSTPPTASSAAMSSDVAAVLGAVSPHEANIARQASAMKRIARLHAQLQSDMTWDPGKREEKEEKAASENDGKDERDQEVQSHTSTPLRPSTTPRRKGRPPPLNPSLIQTPPFRLLPATPASRPTSAHTPSKNKRTQTAPAARRSAASFKASASSAALSPTPFDLPAAVFTRRHLPLARAERRMRAELRRESTEHWITCDACSKWRLQQQHHQQPSPPPGTAPTAASPHYYCGDLGSPSSDECERLDDWIVRCVGEGRAVQLSDVGVDTVEVLVQASGKRRRELERSMERLGMEFDGITQKINLFSATSA